MKDLKPSASLGVFARAQTLALRASLIEKLKNASNSPHSEESIHDLRVAIRRFTQCIRLFESFFRGRAAGNIRKRLKNLLDLCGEVRNHDIAQQLLGEAAFSSGSLIDDLHRSRRHLEKKLARRLRRRKLRRRLDDWSAHLRRGPGSSGDLWNSASPVFENAKRVLPGMASDFFEKGSRATAPGANYQSMHQFRLLAKRLRYTLEIFAPAYSDKLAPALTALRGLQDHLGAINDCVTSRQLTPRNSKADRAIRNLMPAREAGFRAYWKREFPPTAAAIWQSWLTSAISKSEETTHEHLHTKTRGSRAGHRRASRRQSPADSTR